MKSWEKLGRSPSISTMRKVLWSCGDVLKIGHVCPYVICTYLFFFFVVGCTNCPKTCSQSATDSKFRWIALCWHQHLGSTHNLCTALHIVHPRIRHLQSDSPVTKLVQSGWQVLKSFQIVQYEANNCHFSEDFLIPWQLLRIKAPPSYPVNSA